MRCIAVHVPFFPHSLLFLAFLDGNLIQYQIVHYQSLHTIYHTFVFVCVSVCAFVWLLTKFKLYFILIRNSICAAFVNYSSLTQQNLAIMHVIANAFNLSIHSFKECIWKNK